MQVSDIHQISDAIQNERWEHARELREQYVGFMRLLDDLGWSKDPGEAALFDITMPVAWLTRVVLHQQAIARGRLERDLPAPPEVATVLAAYEAVFEQMAERVKAGADVGDAVSIYADEILWREWGQPRERDTGGAERDESGGRDV
jgi:hypothetical protein